jgi:hypothetical protein
VTNPSQSAFSALAASGQISMLIRVGQETAYCRKEQQAGALNSKLCFRSHVALEVHQRVLAPQRRHPTANMPGKRSPRRRRSGRNRAQEPGSGRLSFVSIALEAAMSPESRQRRVRQDLFGYKARCPTDTVVWVNLTSKIYHFSGTGYGNAKHGAYMCEHDTAAAGMRAAKNETHP